MQDNANYTQHVQPEPSWPTWSRKGLQSWNGRLDPGLNSAWGTCSRDVFHVARSRHKWLTPSQRPWGRTGTPSTRVSSADLEYTFIPRRCRECVQSRGALSHSTVWIRLAWEHCEHCFLVVCSSCAKANLLLLVVGPSGMNGAPMHFVSNRIKIFLWQLNENKNLINCFEQCTCHSWKCVYMSRVFIYMY